MSGALTVVCVEVKPPPTELLGHSPRLSSHFVFNSIPKSFTELSQSCNNSSSHVHEKPFADGQRTLKCSLFRFRRPGILVLINDVDWELEGKTEYKVQPGDTIVFISTLHGG